MVEEEITTSLQTEIEPLEIMSTEMLMTAGDVISRALLFTLSRNYLDGPIFGADYVRLLNIDISEQPDVAFLHLEQVGQPVTEDFSHYMTAIQTTLAASHDPRYAMLFIISSDGEQNDIFIGLKAQTPGAHPSLFAEQLGQFLCSNWPGTRVKLIDDYSQIVKQVHVPLSTYRYARAFTGIPSPKGETTQGYPQSLDQFMRGLRGKPYLYMVVAEPMTEFTVDEVISNCRSLSGQVHAFARATIQRSASESASLSTARGESETSSTTTTRGTSTTETEGISKGAIGTVLDKSSGPGKAVKGAGMAAAAAAIGIPAMGMPGGGMLFQGMLGMFGQLLPSSSTSQATGETESVGETAGISTTLTATEGTTTGESLSFGREYLNKHAEACEQLLEETVTRFQVARGKGCWNVGVYLLSNQAETVAQGQAQLKALVSGEKSAFEPVRIHDLSQVWNEEVQVSLDSFQHPALRLFAPSTEDQLSHPLGPIYEGLTTPLNTDELSLFVNLPLRETPGLPVQPTAYFSLNPPKPHDSENALDLGNLLEGGEAVGKLKYSVDLNTLTRHVFVTGITGSGKSNTCRRLLSEMMQRGVNFMVIEPAKDEYVQMALAYNQAGTFDREIAVYMPGRQEWGGQKLEPLRLNPFDVVRLPGALVQVTPHLDRLKSIFNASFPMQEILPVILEEALVELYDSQGWLDDELPPDGIACPTLEQLYDGVTDLVRAKGYEQRITDNIIAALRTRIGSLLRGWKRRLFNHAVSTPWSELFDRPVVVNLQQMGDDADKCFTMALLLNFMYEYRQAQHESLGSPESSDLQHLAIFEEAHRVLRAAPQHFMGANPQAKMGEMFADILAEIRAYGQGLAIIDQVPAKLVPDALKNTNLKIIHRLVAVDDREAMAGTLALKPDQAEVIARLKVGQAIVAGIQDDMASWVKIHYTPMPQVKRKK
ncbi:MAG: ATP-binding protein [Chloroflexi bacterium]|nr:ATP-binding protein [Chloroflexota bacterium]